MFEVNALNVWIIEQVVTKFGSLKRDNGGDAVMSPAAINHYTAHCTLMTLSLLCIFAGTHHCVSLVIRL